MIYYQKNKNSKGKIVIYKNPQKGIDVKVRLENETVWLPLNQIAKLFETDKSGISRHIKNIYKSGELNSKATVAKIATVQKEGKREIKRSIEFYNLDLILSVGYRVNSKRATQFRIWANTILKQYLIKGFAVNEKRLLEAKEKFADLQNVITFLKNKSEKELLKGQAGEILNLLSSYSKTLSVLDQYDSGKFKEIKGKKSVFIWKRKGWFI